MPVVRDRPAGRTPTPTSGASTSSTANASTNATASSTGASAASSTTSARNRHDSARDVGATAVIGGPASARDTARRTLGTKLADGVTLERGRLMVDGREAIDRSQLQRAGASSLLSAATRVCGTGALGKLSATAKKELAQDLVPVLSFQIRGRAALHDVRARSGAFALIEELAVSMKGSGEARTARALVKSLVETAQREDHPGLRAHMERRIAMLPSRVVSPEVADAVEGMRVKHAHERPLRKEWLKGSPPQLDVLASVQDEFWKEELAAYKERGYKVELLPADASGAARARATRKIDDVLVSVDLRERDSNVLDGLAERNVDIVLYTGHANLGGVAKHSVAGGPKESKGTKLVALFACRSKQNVDAVERRYPGQHLLVSSEGTYGHDDRIVLHTLLEGIAKDKTYAQIEMAAKREGLWESKNYSLPNETAAFFGDEPVYMPESKTGVGRSISMRPAQRPARASECPPGPVDDAVAWINTIQGYWAEEFGTAKDKALHDRMVSKGFFDGTASDPVVRVKVVDPPGAAKPVVEISVNSAYANQDPDALAMMVTFAAALEITKLGDPRRSEHDRRMLALSMVSSYVYFLVEYSDTADVLLRQFAKEHGFPPGLSWPVVEKAINADMKHDCSPTTIAALERGMEHVFLEVNPARTSTKFRQYVGAALAVLERSDKKIAALTLDMISTGKVRLDQLDDLTKQDYLRVRKDFLKDDGTKLPADGHRMLGDHSSRAYRAITTDLNGYMWDDRIYLSPGQSPEELASTLVHEVNHVLNKSEEVYRNSEKQNFIEEYRGFYAEELFRGTRMTKAKCKELKEGVIHDYGIKGVAPDDIPDVPPGILERV